MTFVAGSGLPFTKYQHVRSGVIYGSSQNQGNISTSINGSRLPWNYNVNLRIDKRFKIYFGKKENDNRKVAWMEVYMQFLNLINTQNTLRVWGSTGTPTDDGYLTSAEAQPTIASSVNPEGYEDNYNARIHSPTFYSQQRRTRLGLVLNF